VERPGFWRWEPLLLSFVSTRLGLAALTALVAAVSGQSALRLWNHWDGRWYVGIATHGYHWSIGGKPAVAFFPLYPLLIHAGEMIHLPGILAAMTVSTTAFLGALFYLYRLVASERSEPVAARTVWFLALFPTAFFTLAPYSESLFLLAAIAALYYARQGRWLTTAFWLAVVVLARPTGALVIPAVLVALYLQRQSVRVHGAPDRPVERGDLRLVASDTGRERSREPLSPGLAGRMSLALLPALIGFAAYLIYLHIQRIPLSLLLVAQRSWHRSLTVPWAGFTGSVTWLIHHGTHNLPWAFENVLEGMVTVLCLVLTVLAWKSMRWDARLYCLGFWALILTTPEWRDGYHAPFSSVDRFVLTLFPVFAWAAERTPARLRPRLAVVSTLTMVAMTSTYLMGGWIG
jgi:hypothetical protein